MCEPVKEGFKILKAWFQGLSTGKPGDEGILWLEIIAQVSSQLAYIRTILWYTVSILAQIAAAHCLYHLCFSLRGYSCCPVVLTAFSTLWHFGIGLSFSAQTENDSNLRPDDAAGSGHFSSSGHCCRIIQFLILFGCRFGRKAWQEGHDDVEVYNIIASSCLL